MEGERHDNGTGDSIGPPTGVGRWKRLLPSSFFLLPCSGPSSMAVRRTCWRNGGVPARDGYVTTHGEWELAARVGGIYIARLHGSLPWILLISFDSRAAEEFQPLIMPSSMSKDRVGINRDQISEESWKLQSNPQPRSPGTSAGCSYIVLSSLLELRVVFRILVAIASYEFRLGILALLDSYEQAR